MIRRLVRVLGLLLLAGAFALLVIDGTRSIAGGRFIMVSLDTLAATLGDEGQITWAAGLARWFDVATPLGPLGALPAAVASGLSGLLLVLATRPRTAPIRR